jgi:hypothetical protein
MSRLSLREAINAKCKECIYDPKAEAGTWRQQVEACTSKTCPLFEVRPTSIKSEPTDPSESVQDLTVKADFRELVTLYK